MTTYALTFPQLVAQAMRRPSGDRDITRLRAGYDLAECMADGLYRSQGCAFINHLVRTSSIVMAHGGSLEETLAAMLHSAYMLDCFEHSRRRRFRAEDRVELANCVGREVEEIVWEYHRLGWGRRDILAAHLERLPTYGPAVRAALRARLANELEDYLDLAVLYRPKYSYRNRIESLGSLCIDLAQQLDMAELGRELDAAYRATLSTQLPGAAVRTHINAYELPRRHYQERNKFEYAVDKSGKLIRRLRRHLFGEGRKPAQ